MARRHSPSLVTRSVSCFDHFGEAGVRQVLRQGEPVHARRLEHGSAGPWSIDWLEKQLCGDDEWTALEQTASQVSDDSAIRDYLFPFVSAAACDTTTWGYDDAARSSLSMREVCGSSLRALLAGRQTGTESAAATPARYFRHCISQPHELSPPADGGAVSWRHASGVQPGLAAAIEGLDWDALHATLSAAAACTGGGVRVRSVQVFAATPGASQRIVSPLHFDETHMLVLQLVGRKRLLLLPASAYGALRPYPASHPLDRRARCEVAAANPALDEGVARSLGGAEVVLGAGEVLYVPPYYFHEVCTVGTRSVRGPS